MQRLMLDGPGAVRWEHVDEPELSGEGAALVRPIVVATCDVDVAVLQGRYPAPGAPYAFGHEAVGEVVAVGSEVRSVAPGDRVVITFQISCGACDPCRQGRTGDCASHPRLATYGLGSMGGYEWGGLLADLVAVPHADAMLVRVPPAIDVASIASCSDNLSDAWRTVGPHLAADPGAEVLVVGGDGGPNSIGHTGRAHVRSAIPAVLELVAAGLDLSPVTSAVVPWHDAPAALADPPMKLVVSRAGPDATGSGVSGRAR